MIEKGSFETTRGEFQNMLNWISAPLNVEKYDKAWLNLQDDTLHTVASMKEQVVGFCTFQEPFVKEIEVDESNEGGMETLINVVDVQSYLEFVGGENIKVTFFGNEDENLCRKMEIDGDLSVSIYVPSSEADYESQQTGIVNVYDDENRWCKPSDGARLSTRFTTRVEEFERIIQVKEFDDFAMSTYPVVIEDGEFVLNASDENERNSVGGTLYSKNVEGPDVNNSYSRGFSELFNNISGEIQVDIEQDTPISVVRQSNDDAMTLRYTLLPTA